MIGEATLSRHTRLRIMSLMSPIVQAASRVRDRAEVVVDGQSFVNFLVFSKRITFSTLVSEILSLNQKDVKEAHFGHLFCSLSQEGQALQPGTGYRQHRASNRRLDPVSLQGELCDSTRATETI